MVGLHFIAAEEALGYPQQEWKRVAGQFIEWEKVRQPHTCLPECEGVDVPAAGTHVDLVSSPSASAARRSLVQRVSAAAGDVEEARSSGQPAPLAMARGRRGFVIAGLISELLDEEAVVHRDNFAVANSLCVRAHEVLGRFLGPTLIKKYAAGTRVADLDTITTQAHVELFNSAPEDVDVIADAMITLAARLEDLFTAVAQEESRPVDLRNVARDVSTIAGELWATYGGDGGGW